MNKLKLIAGSALSSIYEIETNTSGKQGPRLLVASTPETRSICNDPAVCGVLYTDVLRRGCARIVKSLADNNLFMALERRSVVLNLLRGSLNFGLREALQESLGWNMHSSAFVSAQRARHAQSPEDWHITEAHYQKVSLPQDVDVIFGDVVATGTSLSFALKRVCEVALAEGKSIRSFLFFTFGSAMAESVLSEVDEYCRGAFKGYQGAIVIYLEGRFAVADGQTPLTIKITGTDLLRSGGLVAPEFLASQMEHPAYPLERCVIYDAGSRAFHIEEYLDDVINYWKQTLEIGRKGVTYHQLLLERMPEIANFSLLQEMSLVQLAEERIKRLIRL